MPTTFPEGAQRIFPSSLLRLGVEHYIMKYVLEEEPAVARLAAEATVESVTILRHKDTFGHALLLCRLRLPNVPDRTITVLLERFAATGGGPGPSSSASSSASIASSSTAAEDSLTVSTAKTDAELVGHDYQVHKVLTFPHRSPTFVDLLALAKLVSQSHPVYTLTNHSCIFYVLAVHNTMQEAFSGNSRNESQTLLPYILSVVNAYNKDFKLINESFETARAVLRSQIEVIVSKDDALRQKISSQSAWIAAQENRIVVAEERTIVAEERTAVAEQLNAAHVGTIASQQGEIVALRQRLAALEVGKRSSDRDSD
ncbi:hypothetical protein C8J57DRAFT_1460414 [Mycena rebaudengoi]|nr:hypothetical protein C8J57DRAFT_1460414 [Mycena rebaudengoi]